MIDIKLTIDVAEALRALDAIDQGGWARQVGAHIAGEEVIPRLRTYPPPSGRPQPPKSAKQRRKVFALIKAGKIPYHRTSKLAVGWDFKTTSLYQTTVKNSVGYVDLVQGANQAPYHRGTWPTVDLVAENVENTGAAQRVAERVIQEEIDRYNAGP